MYAYRDKVNVVAFFGFSWTNKDRPNQYVFILHIDMTPPSLQLVQTSYHTIHPPRRFFVRRGALSMRLINGSSPRRRT